MQTGSTLVSDKQVMIESKEQTHRYHTWIHWLFLDLSAVPLLTHPPLLLSYKCAGLRLTWIDDDWVRHSRLIACRHYNPSSQLRDEVRASELLADYVKSCLAEFNLNVQDIYAVVTDSGSDVKRCATHSSCLNKPWEWCGPHLLNRALIDGVGYSEKKDDSNNLSGRELIMQMRNVISKIKKSTTLKVRVHDEDGHSAALMMIIMGQRLMPLPLM